MIERVLAKAVATVRSRGLMYKAMAQSVLLYGSDIWVVMGDILKFLEGFHHRAAMRVAGMTATRGEGSNWGYLLVVAEMESAANHPIREYIRRRKATIAEKVVYRPIDELCAWAERMPVTSWVLNWWDQDVVNEPEE